MSKNLANIEQELQKEIQAIAGGIAPVSQNITTKDRMFTFPDGKKTVDPINVIIVGFGYHNLYYTTAYQQDNISGPKCYAIGDEPTGMVPSAHAEEQVNPECDPCPMNQFGTAANGGAGKACQNRVKLAVIPPDFTPDTTPYTISVSPTGLTSWKKYLRTLGASGKHFLTVSTEIKFDSSKSYPTLLFSAGEEHNRISDIIPFRNIAKDIVLSDVERT